MSPRIPFAVETLGSKLSMLPLFLCVTAIAHSQTISAVSVDVGGATADSFSSSPSVSANGRFVAFSSAATNLILIDSNNAGDIFVRDRVAGTTVRVSVDSLGVAADGNSTLPAISADGRYVAFSSFATNLVANDTNATIDAFVHDTLTSTTTRVSVSSTGTEASGSAGSVSISGDGRFVTFQCEGANLVVGDTNGVSDIFVHDRLSGQTTRVSLDSSGAEGNATSSSPRISGDGRYVSFTSEASNLVAVDTNFVRDVFVRDTFTGLTERVSLTSTGTESSGGESAFSAISGDGRFVAFGSTASNLVLGDTNGVEDIFVRDRTAGTTRRVSVGPVGAQGNLSSSGCAISAAGRHVSFYSLANNLISPLTMTVSHVFVHDILTGTTTLVSRSDAGSEGNDGSYASSISAGGDVVAFESYADNFVATDLNFTADIFARQVGAPPGTPFCFGDSSGPACPCAGISSFGHGCPHSLSASGSNLAGSGMASVSADSLALRSTNVPSGPGLYIQGSDAFGGGPPIPFGDGQLCVNGAIVRLGVVFASGGASQYPRAGIDPSVSVTGFVSAGDVRYYQMWFRDGDPGFCTPSTFNLTNGYQVTWAQ